jgi:hypothetical protein
MFEGAPINLIPDVEKVSRMFANALAPSFFLGAVAAFVSLMTLRLGVVSERIRVAIRARTDASGPVFDRLRRRAKYLHDGIVLSLGAGVASTLLLAMLFAVSYFQLKHAFGAVGLFVTATLLMFGALIRFLQEALSARAELDDALDDLDRERREHGGP